MVERTKKGCILAFYYIPLHNEREEEKITYSHFHCRSTGKMEGIWDKQFENKRCAGYYRSKREEKRQM